MCKIVEVVENCCGIAVNISICIIMPYWHLAESQLLTAIYLSDSFLLSVLIYTVFYFGNLETLFCFSAAPEQLRNEVTMCLCVTSRFQ